MRKINPDDLKSDFDRRMCAVRDFHILSEKFLKSMADKSVLCESTLLRGAVLWEGFLGDLFVAYINRDSREFARHLERSIESTIEGKAERIYKKFGKLSVPKHIDVNTIRHIVDDEGFNVAFRSAKEIVDKSAAWLVDEHKRKFSSLNGKEKAIVNLLFSIRNHLAHDSQNSFERMNSALATGALHGTGYQRQQRKLTNVGSYLKAAHNGQSRIEKLIQDIRDIASKL